jgi:hypothetical protein
MSPGSVITLLDTYWASHQRTRQRTFALDAWVTGQQYDAHEQLNLDATDPFYGRPYSPRETDEEYDDLSSKSVTPWGGLVVSSLAQTAYINGVRMPGSMDNLEVWESWQRNRMDSRQISAFRAAIGHGVSYGVVKAGADAMTGDKMAKIHLRSGKRMSAYYQDDDDEWPMFAIDATQWAANGKTGWNVSLFDEQVEHKLSCEGNGFDKSSWNYITNDPHPFNVTPVARLVNSEDLDGKATGEIEPVIPLLRRIDQDTFDRLVVQRFGAWKIRYIAGMAKPSTTQAANLQALKLKVEDLLISDNKDTKFGTLDATPVDGFIALTDADLRMLSAVSQIPPHHLLGLSSNLQAEALAAAEAGLQRKSNDFKLHAGEWTEQVLRMCAVVTGNKAEARAFDMQVRWADTESRSLTQAADALGKIAVQLKVPLEMLWERLPGWTDSDTERAKILVQEDGFEALLQELGAGQGNTDPGTASGNNPAA